MCPPASLDVCDMPLGLMYWHFLFTDIICLAMIRAIKTIELDYDSYPIAGINQDQRPTFFFQNKRFKVTPWSSGVLHEYLYIEIFRKKGSIPRDDKKIEKKIARDI